VQNIDYPNSQTDFTYTDRDRIESLHIAGADGEFKRFYGFDDVGNLIDEYSDLSASPSTQIGHYDYDDTYRLTGVTDFNDYYGGDMSYDYDAVGNIRQNNDIVYDYEEGNDRLSSDGTFDYEYDARGNLKTKTLTGTNIKTRYFYDYENRLSTVILPDGSAINYYYDADGSRVKKTDWEGTTIYIYDAKGNVVYEKFLPAE
jgi:YD repeat-containing protein